MYYKLRKLHKLLQKIWEVTQTLLLTVWEDYASTKGLEYFHPCQKMTVIWKARKNKQTSNMLSLLHHLWKATEAAAGALKTNSTNNNN